MSVVQDLTVLKSNHLSSNSCEPKNEKKSHIFMYLYFVNSNSVNEIT